MSLFVAAAALSLIAIGPDDGRLQSKRTVVSQEARTELAKDDGMRVLCVDRRRSPSICLTEVQWFKAIVLAAAQQDGGKRARGGLVTNSGLDAGFNYPSWPDLGFPVP